MNAYMAYMNGAVSKHGNKTTCTTVDDFALLNTLLSGPADRSSVIERGSLKDQQHGERKDQQQREPESEQAEQESEEETVSERGGFHNDPDEPTNPNEVRERHLKKLKR